jgi:hypothetical protein
MTQNDVQGNENICPCAVSLLKSEVIWSHRYHSVRSYPGDAA